MALNATQKKFVQDIGNASVSYYSKYKILPSLTIAQACLESNYGASGLSKDCYNYFGMKWSSTASCGYKEYLTKEQRKDGTIYTITAKFRKYKNMSDGIKGYYEFLQFKRYQNLKGVTDYEQACKLIREDGWATDLSYTTKLIKLIEDNELWKYDLKVLKFNKINKSSTKTAIRALQTRLNEVAKSKLVVDGKYGPATQKAVLAYWEKIGWNKEGKSTGLTAGEKTCKKLGLC